MPKLAVLGQPVSHSRSPAMQNAALAELGLAPEWEYGAIDVAPEDLGWLVPSLPGRGYAGVNVTVPHKVAALALADTASAAAAEIGAANTLSFRDGAIHADNTDAGGLIGALAEPVSGRRALVLGAGGSARAAVWALREAGAQVSVWNRTEHRALALAAELGAIAVESTGDFDLLVNCTTVGMGVNTHTTGGPLQLKGLPVDADSLKARHVVVDLVYGDQPTPLLRAAVARGSRVVDGLEVLVHQGAASLRIWTGVDAPIETMRQAARQDVTREGTHGN